MGNVQTIHFVDRDVRSRAEVAREALALGHHAEVYTGLEELAKHPPREGIIVAREDGEEGGVHAIIERLNALTIALPVVIASEMASVGRVVEAVRRGAIDYLSLPVEPDQLASMIQRAGPRAAAETLARQRMLDARRLLVELSDREREVLEMLVDGGSNKRIARDLSISPRTVEIHRANMMRKLGVKHIVQAVRLSFVAQGEALGRAAG